METVPKIELACHFDMFSVIDSLESAVIFTPFSKPELEYYQNAVSKVTRAPTIRNHASKKDPLKIQKIWGEPFIGTRSNVIVTQLFC